MALYRAKSGMLNGRPVTVSQHCLATAKLAARYGQDVGMEYAAFIVGLFHDFGKYSYLFQAVLDGRMTGIDHALPGAAVLYSRNMPAPLIMAAAGHHGGLRSLDELEGHLQAVLSSKTPGQGPFGKQPSLCGMMSLSAALTQFSEELDTMDVSRFSGQVWTEYSEKTWPEWKRALSDMLMARMLFSCQVDADYTVSSDLPEPARPAFDAGAGMARLVSYLENIRGRSRAMSCINDVRNQVFQACGTAGSNAEDKFMTLTAPTGSGKTLGMLHFALKRMAADSTKKRVIFVLPFLTLIDQSVETIQAVMRDVTVDSSAVFYESEQDRLLTETWDGPCVVTTTVQFFNSLFSDRPGDCRKLHNMANSIIIFDEMQALPLPVSRIAMQTLGWLSERFNTDILISTATQPAYALLKDLSLPVCTEIVPAVRSLFLAMPEKPLEWRPEPVTPERIAEEAAGLNDVCVICNLRRQALAVFQAWQAAGVTDCCLLTADLCPEHRRDVIKFIKQRQAEGKPVHVVATQCIEAGVDLDFQNLYRAMAPLVAVLQAAGRFDRNGLHPDGKLVVFEFAAEPGKRSYPGGDYAKQAGITKAMLSAGMDILSLDSVEQYYGKLFMKTPEPQALMDALEAEDYPAVAKEARLIKNSGARVIVPYGDGTMWRRLLDAVDAGIVTKQMLAEAASVSVSSYDMAGIRAHCQELETGFGERRRSTGVYILLNGHEGCYRSDTGLNFDDDSMFML